MSSFSCLLLTDMFISEKIVMMTGIDEALLKKCGIPLEKGIDSFINFIEDGIIVGHNISFDMEFIVKAAENLGKRVRVKKTIDTLELARRQIKGVTNYRLATIIGYFDISSKQTHRALADCYLTWEIYKKLKIF